MHLLFWVKVMEYTLTLRVQGTKISLSMKNGTKTSQVSSSVAVFFLCLSLFGSPSLDTLTLLSGIQTLNNRHGASPIGEHVQARAAAAAAAHV